jgi:tRNA G46 methylase TrmB
LQAISRQVSSNQRGIHPKLATVVRRHLETDYRREPSVHTLQAHTELLQELERRPRPMVLDSFCGTGQSTALLAARHPDHLVVGIDKSAHRLARHEAGEPDNYLLLQADCPELWQLLIDAGHRADYHYLLYPNPWPKPGHLQRRVHGHASLPALLALGGELELRSNWQLYIEEFGVAMHIAGQRGYIRKLPAVDADLSLFERKYRRSGHALWSYRLRIAP